MPLFAIWFSLFVRIDNNITRRTGLLCVYLNPHTNPLMYNKFRRTMIMLCIPSKDVSLLRGNEERLTVLRVVTTTLPTICIFHLYSAIERISLYYCYSFSRCSRVEDNWNSKPMNVNSSQLLKTLMFVTSDAILWIYSAVYGRLPTWHQHKTLSFSYW